MSNLSFIHTDAKQQTDLKINGSNIFPLTAREQEVQMLLTTGMTNKMLARELGICEGTVKVHVKNLMRKLNAPSRLEVALRMNMNKQSV